MFSNHLDWIFAKHVNVCSDDPHFVSHYAACGSKATSFYVLWQTYDEYKSKLGLKNRDKFNIMWLDSRTNSATNKLWQPSRNSNNFMPIEGIHVFVTLISKQKTKPRKERGERIGNQLPILWNCAANSLITLHKKWFMCSFLRWYHKSYWELEEKDRKYRVAIRLVWVHRGGIRRL